MTLKADIIADMDALLMNTDEFAETITYTPSGGAALSIPAVVLRETLETEQSENGLENRYYVDVVISLTDVAAPSQADVVTFDGLDWNVIGPPLLPGDGGARLRVYRREPYEKSAPGHRLER